MTDFELLQLNQEGFIPGPGESEEEFILRVNRAKKEYSDLKEEAIPKAHWEWVGLHLKELFDFSPCYLSAFYSNCSLAPWQGAASWIEGRALKAIQLRKALQKGTYLGLYRREEILAHEAVHAARSGFAESQGEEFFAYMTSEKKWRRILGPILQRPIEAWSLLLCLLGACLGELISMWREDAQIFSSLCFCGAALWIGLGFFRLAHGHLRMRRAGEAILEQTKNISLVRAILVRLTDEEIKMFSKGKRIDQYAQKQSCLRWRLIRTAYLMEGCYGRKNSD